MARDEGWVKVALVRFEGSARGQFKKLEPLFAVETFAESWSFLLLIPLPRGPHATTPQRQPSKDFKLVHCRSRPQDYVISTKTRPDTSRTRAPQPTATSAQFPPASPLYTNSVATSTCDLNRRWKTRGSFDLRRLAIAQVRWPTLISILAGYPYLSRACFS